MAEHSNTGTVAFAYTAVLDPDVCIVTDGSTVYALVAYYKTSATTRYYYEFFKWVNTGTWTFASGGATAFASGSFSTTINVDASNAGDFVIIWDDASNNHINVITGGMSAGSAVLNNGGSAVYTGVTGINPDVCIFAGGGNKRVYYCYLNMSGVLYVDYDSFSNLASNTPSNSSYNNYSPTGSWGYPRIACPNTGGSLNDWTVVIDEVVSGSYYIRGKTYYNGSFNADTYNTGVGNSPSDISGYLNIFPAVAYDSRPVTAATYNVWVAWTMDNSTGNIGGATQTAVYPIAVKCNKQGAIVTGGAYWDIPTSINMNDDIQYVSLAGRYTTNSGGNDKLLVTYAHVTNTDVIFKQKTPSGSANFRIENSETISNDFISDGNNLFNIDELKNSKILYFQVLDLVGKTIFSSEGEIQHVADKFRNWAVHAPEEICLIQIITENNSITRKIFIGN